MEKTDRTLAIFYRALKGEKITSARIAAEYNISTKSVSRYIEDIRNFLAENRELVGNSELIYNRSEKCYTLQMDDFLKDSELLAVVKILIGTRAFSKPDLLRIISKMKHFVSAKDRQLLEELISKEKYHYTEVKSDCDSVIDNLWRIAGNIKSRNEITITYYKMSREKVTHRIRPVSIMFSEYYFYLIAYKVEDENLNPIYFRVDRISDIIEHRTKFDIDRKYDFDEGELRKKILLMFPGKCRKIRFEFSGPSLQAILDKLPTANVIEINGNKALIEAEIYGTGIMMFLLSQGSWVKVISPDEFVQEYKEEISKIQKLYLEKN
ncbi:MAG: WYL domain-containing protein [Oscillospiraceae bacterium]|nr:WYL domain-containing protein [Oscillospiraceae bacterium]MDY6207919.1 WYL domain-containing protein [Oscillospiraceae bacterium]